MDVWWQSVVGLAGPRLNAPVDLSEYSVVVYCLLRISRFSNKIILTINT